MSRIESYLKNEPPLRSAVVAYFIDDKGRILLGLRKTSSWKLGEGITAGIGGKVGDHEEFKDETPDDAIIREAKEEIGVDVLSFKHMGKIKFLFPTNPKWDQIVDIYIINEWEGIPQETESIAPMWYEMDRLPLEQMWPDNIEWVPIVIGGNRIDATFLYNDDEKTIAERVIQILND